MPVSPSVLTLISGVIGPEVERRLRASGWEARVTAVQDFLGDGISFRIQGTATLNVGGSLSEVDIHNARSSPGLLLERVTADLVQRFPNLITPSYQYQNSRNLGVATGAYLPADIRGLGGSGVQLPREAIDAIVEGLKPPEPVLKSRWDLINDDGWEPVAY